MVVQVIEEILRNEARVVLDISGVTTFDNVGLEAALTRGHRAIFRRNSSDWRWECRGGEKSVSSRTTPPRIRAV